jgi:peroxiredoxin
MHLWLSKFVALVLLAVSLSGCMHLNARPVSSGSLERAPDFSLPDANGNVVNLEALTARGPVVLIFSRGAWCPFCKRHLAALARDESRFAQAGVSLVSISTDSAADSLALAREEQIHFPLLSDSDGAIAARYGALMEGDRDGVPVAVPAAFLIRPDGSIAWSVVGHYPWSTTSADELLAHVHDVGNGAVVSSHEK